MSRCDVRGAREAGGRARDLRVVRTGRDDGALVPGAVRGSARPRAARDVGCALPARPRDGAVARAQSRGAPRGGAVARGDLRAVAAVAEDGCDRPPRRRRRARLQQPPARDQRLRRVPLGRAHGRAAEGIREGDPVGRRARRGADPATARVQPPPGAAAARPQPERRGARDRVDAAPPDRRRRAASTSTSSRNCDPSRPTRARSARCC